MALTDENGGGIPATMLVSPSGGMNNGSGFGDWGGSGFWIILLFILLGGWGNGFGGGYGGFGGGINELYPWMNNSQNINSGFRDQMLNDNITSIRDGVYGINNQLCSGFAGVNQNLCQTGNSIVSAVTAAQNGISQQLYNGEIASLNRSFAEQTANTQGFTGVNSGIADLRYTAATEACATRTQSAQNTRDIIDAQTRGTQAILDKLCALELDGVKGQLAAAQRENVGLQNQLNMATMQASQNAQNAFISQGFANEVDALYNRLNSCPVPTTPVYGRTPIFTCGGNSTGCGCGGNTFVNG